MREAFGRDGNFTDVADPAGLAKATGGMSVEQLLGVNDHDKAVGFWTDAQTNNHGFTYDIKSSGFSAVDIAGCASTTTTAINNEGQVVGSFTNATHGFLFDEKSKAYTTIDDPNGVKGPTAMTVVNGINDKGQLVGFYLDAAGNTDGMLVQLSGHHSS